jgi:aminoglycoside phosphotransferase (APT) family kinase protein
MDDRLPSGAAAARAGQRLGRAVELIERYDLGAEGAYRVSVDGIAGVLKYWSGERSGALRLATAVAAHGELRGYGWPLPAIQAWHSEAQFAFVLESHMPGQRADRVSEQLCSQLLALLSAVPPGAGGRSAGSGEWVALLERSLYDDLPLSPCRPRLLRRTAVGRRLVAHARTALGAARPRLSAARDIIHADFSAGNILCDARGDLAAVLDWQHGCVGHRAFDLIGLEWDLALRLNVGSAPALAGVTARVEEQVEEPIRAFCRAYYAVWNLSWALDTPDEQEVLQVAAALGVLS